MSTSRTQMYCVRRPTDIAVVAPVGGFGNHLRWLLLLSPEFSFVAAATQDHYNTVRGPSWSDHHEYVQGIIPKTLADEVQGMAPRHAFVTEQDRMTFVLTNVYHPNRKFDNWLSFEWGWRNFMSEVIDFSHEVTDPQKKTVLIQGTPELCLKSYAMFNPKLMGYHDDHNGFINYIERTNQYNVAALSTSQYYNLTSQDLYHETLDQTLYHDITAWLNITPVPDLAQAVHELWYQAHQQCIKDYQTGRSCRNRTHISKFEASHSIH